LVFLAVLGAILAVHSDLAYGDAARQFRVPCGAVSLAASVCRSFGDQLLNQILFLLDFARTCQATEKSAIALEAELLVTIFFGSYNPTPHIRNTSPAAPKASPNTQNHFCRVSTAIAEIAMAIWARVTALAVM